MGILPAVSSILLDTFGEPQDVPLENVVLRSSMSSVEYGTRRVEYPPYPGPQWLRTAYNISHYALIWLGAT